MAMISRCYALFSLLVVLTAGNANAGVVVGGTRLVYHEKDKEESIKVSNTDDSAPWLIQSWTDNNGVKGDQKSEIKPPFIVTPPLFRLNPENEHELRIIRTGGNFPADRESIFWLNIKAIPAKPKNNNTRSMLQFSVKTRIKLFFRPFALTSDSGQESQKLHFSRQGNQLRVDNPTGYFMTFYHLSIGGQPVNTIDIMVPPKGFSLYPLPSNAKSDTVTWQVINDFGGASTPESDIAS